MNIILNLDNNKLFFIEKNINNNKLNLKKYTNVSINDHYFHTISYEIKYININLYLRLIFE